MRQIAPALLCLLLSALTARADIPLPASEDETAALLLAELQARLPDAKVEPDPETKGFRVTLADGTAVLTQAAPLHEALLVALDGAAREQALHQYVTILIEDAAKYVEDQALDLARVLPVIRPIAILSQSEPPVPSLPFAPGLVVVWVQDSTSASRTLTEADLAESGLDDVALQGRAVLNLAARRDKITLHREGKLNWITLDGFYDSSLLLDQTFWTGEAQTIAPVAVIPGPGVLAWVNGDDPEAMAILRDLGTQFYRQDPMPISPRPLRWSPSGWTAVED